MWVRRARLDSARTTRLLPVEHGRVDRRTDFARVFCLTNGRGAPRLSPSTRKEARMPWKLKGSYVETCSCDLICPCNASFDHGATYDFCRATLVFEIREGEIEGTGIGDLNVVAIIDTPKVMTDGNWKLGVFIDDRADDEQADKLTRVFTCALGGPM